MPSLPHQPRPFVWGLLLTLMFAFAISAASPSAFAQSRSSLACRPCTLDFGNVKVGHARSLPITLSNSGNSEIVIHRHENHAPGVSLKGVTFPRHLQPGESAQFHLVFRPRTGQKLNGKITYHSSASNGALAITVVGTAAASAGLTANPPTLSFGNVPVGKTATLNQTVTNTGTTNITLEQVADSGVGFTVSGIQPPLTLAPGHSVTFQANFAPSKPGSSSGSISVLTSQTNYRLSVTESGTGASAGVLGLAPSSLSFGKVTVGSSKALNATLSASGGSVTVNSDALSSSEYAVSGLSLPLTLSAGQNVSFQVTFTPQTSGTASGNLSVAGSGGSSSSASLAGTGVAASQHSVSLSWQDNASSIAGYNVYRGTVSGGPYNKLNTSLDASTSFTDSSVASGSVYYYVVTAVDTQGVESADSQQVSASVPTP